MEREFPSTLVFGPFFYLSKGLWKKAITLLAFSTVLYITLELMLPKSYTAWAVGGVLFATLAARDYYKLKVLKQDNWFSFFDGNNSEVLQQDNESQEKTKPSVTQQAFIIVGSFLGVIFIGVFLFNFAQGFFDRVNEVTRVTSQVAPAKVSHSGEYTNGVGITMVNIPAGSFIMGSCKLTQDMEEENKKRAFLAQPPIIANCGESDAVANDDETPLHKVTVSSFQMGKTEVTLGQFKRFIAAAGRTDLVDDDFIKYNSNGDSAPVVQVSWYDAQAFIKWLNKADGGGYRLPSEAEWEYACRAGGNHTYCGSNDVDAVAWYDGNSGNRARAVGGKQANAFGLHDMSGNVYEWTQDCWNNSYNGAPTNGAAWTLGDCEDRVLRGGSWIYYARGSRAAGRSYYSADNRYSNIGFRLARTR